MQKIRRDAVLSTKEFGRAEITPQGPFGRHLSIWCYPARLASFSRVARELEFRAEWHLFSKEAYGRYADATGAPYVSSVFLSHTSADKPFVRQLAGRLRQHRVRVWLDEAKLVAGQSLFDTIGAASDEMRFLVIVLSEQSVESGWVKNELGVAMARQLRDRDVSVIPIVIDKTDEMRMPPFLRDKLWIDFSDPTRFDLSLARLLRSIGAAKSLLDSIAGLVGEFETRDERGMPLRDIRQGREWLCLLATDPIYDIALNRRWLYWYLAQRLSNESTRASSE